MKRYKFSPTINGKIKEFYKLDNWHGSFLCIDSKNECHHFITHTEKSLENIQEHYNKLDIHISDFIKTREKIPFFREGKYYWAAF